MIDSIDFPGFFFMFGLLAAIIDWSLLSSIADLVLVELDLEIEPPEEELLVVLDVEVEEVDPLVVLVLELSPPLFPPW